MHRRFIYRFASLGLLLLLLATSVSLQAQDEDEEEDSTTLNLSEGEAVIEENDQYRSSQYQEQQPSLRTVSPKVVDSLKRDDDFAYANDPAYLVKKEEPRRNRRSFWENFDEFFGRSSVRTIAYILLIVFILFVIYKIIIANNLFYSRKKGYADDAYETEEINDENMDDRINKAISEKDYRSAVRFLYLKTLRLLNDRGWIKYHAQSTNHDYVYQLKQNAVAGDFRFLTQVYDYVWYGEFVVNDDQFGRLHSDFKRFYQAVR